MQTKGFIKVITVLLILVCAFYLSFTFVANHYETKGEQYAMTKAKINTPDMANDTYKNEYNRYMDSIAKKKVYLGYYTFQQVRENQLGLGLDLKGGMNVTLQISVPDILNALASNPDDAKFKKAIAAVQANRVAQDNYVESFCNEYHKLGGGSLYNQFRGIQKLKDDPNASDAKVEQVLKDEVEAMVDNSYKVLRTRIDKFGVVAPNIQKLQSTGRILMELPGIKEPERVKNLLKGTANLEFYETYKYGEISDKIAEMMQAADKGVVKPAEQQATDSTATAAAKTDSAKAQPATAQAQPQKADAADANQGRKLSQMLQLLGQTDNASVGVAQAGDTAAINRMIQKYGANILPKNLKLAWTVKAERNYNNLFVLVALKTNAQGKARMTGDGVTEAQSEYDNMKGQIVTMAMNDEGSRQWSAMTRDNVHRQVAVVLDGSVYSYPNVQNQIDGGRTEITGDFTVEEANDLANVLQSGKMVAGVDIVSESVIGPSLGQESINKGMISFVVALILLMIMMISVYGLKAGNIANLGLVLNLFFTFGILASFRSVLTLPGIAGIVLSLGMAVDANVLIFERCKEELRNGKNLKAAIKDGYSNAFSAIFDGNLTSIITGVILAYLGTGPIKGFAVTLIIGICCSFFTAVFATRLVLENFVNKNRFGFGTMTFTTNWAKNLMQGTHFDFIGKRKKVSYIVGAIIVVFAIALATLGLSEGIDFSGGRNYVVQFKHSVVPEQLQTSLEQQFPGATVSVITIDNDTKVRVSTNYKIEDQDPKVDAEIYNKLYQGLKSEVDKDHMNAQNFSVSDESYGVISSEVVGPSIASDMLRSAIWAVLFSLIAMALYILLRFRNLAFSLGALAAVAFTSYIVIGFFTLHGMLPFSMEVDQTFIAAILTVIGYQINDTVVVFDRVREYRRLYPKQDEKERFNNALNSTLSRTMMTSLSTLLVLVVIFLLGGESIRAFNFAMILGVVFGTCCSLFVAAPVAYKLVSRKEKKEAVVGRLQK